MLLPPEYLVRRKLAASVLAGTAMLALTIATGGCERSGGIVVHPVDSLRVLPVSASTIDLATADTGGASEQELRTTFRSSIKQEIIGQMIGRDEVMFGSIGDVDTDVDGNLYVLDPRYNEIRVFDSSGVFQYAFGIMPDGKRKLRSPRAIAVDSAKRVYVADLPNVVHVFVPAHGGHEFRESFDVKVEPFDLCIMRNALYVNGATFGAPDNLHEFDLQGRLIRSFGSVYKSSDPLIDYGMARGRLACDTSDEMLFFAPASVLAEVIAYRSNGNAAWATRFAGFRPMKVTQLPKGASKTEVPPDGFNRIDAIDYLPSTGTVLVQISHVQPHAAARPTGRPISLEVDELRTFALSGSTGRGAFLSSELPPVSQADSRSFVSVYDTPYPHLQRRRLKLGAWGS